MTTDHPAVEAVARYLAREYWGNQESEGDHTTEARAIVQIVETARRPYTPWSEVKARREAEREMRVALGISDPCECGCGLALHRLVFDNPQSYRIPCDGCECQMYSLAGREVRDVGRIARVWAVGDPEPEDSPLVRDADGAGWVREAEGWITAVGHHPWDTLLRVWGPVTEVREP